MGVALDTLKADPTFFPFFDPLRKVMGSWVILRLLNYGREGEGREGRRRSQEEEVGRGGGGEGVIAILKSQITSFRRNCPG